MQIKTAIRTATILAVLAAMLVMVLALRQQAEPILLQRAVRTFKTPTGYEFGKTYHWVAPHTLLAVLFPTNYNVGEDYRQVVRIATDTGHVSFLQPKNDLTREATNWAFSPDGHRYLFCTYDDKGFAYYLCATDNAKPEKVYSERSNGLPCYPFAWLGDSHHWLSMTGSDKPVELRSLSSIPASRLKIPRNFETGSLLLSAGPTHTILQQSWDSEEELRMVRISILNLDLPASSRQMEVPLPALANVMEVSLSPRGDRLAWLLHVRHEASFYNRVCRLSRFLRPISRRDSDQIWITELNGSSPHLVGSKEIKRVWNPGTGCFPSGWDFEGGVESLVWTVDAQHLSFLYQDAVWTVPTS